MHLVHFTPAILLALASISSASVIHYELRSEPAANASDTAYDAVLEASPPALRRDGPDDKVFLTRDNSCGKIGAGKNHGWYCDAKKDQGGACCSSDGWCGNGPGYCEIGCQKDFGHCDKGVEKPGKPVVKCGPKNKNKKCSSDECCSPNGFCGKNKNFCGIGCQDKFGKCNDKAKPLPKLNPAPKPLEHRCGPANSNQTCPGVECCSHAGYCGIGTAYCAVPQNCLRGFGRCDSDMFPAGLSTLKDPRPQLGKIEYGKFIMDCKEPGTVAMTFDDGPNVYTDELLDTLKEAGAKVTFVVGGNNNGRQVDQGDVWPKLLKRMVAEGHQIASHTWSHPHLDALKSEDRKIDMAKTERAIANIIGKYPTYMRPPYSACEEKSGCLKDMTDMGYALLGQSFDTLDWQYAGGQIQISAQLVEDYFDTLGPKGHALICQHDTLGSSVQELAPLILTKIKDKGFRAVTVGECLGDDMKNWYRVPGKGTSWVGVGTAQVEVEEESHKEEKRDSGSSFGPHADALPTPYPGAPSNIDTDRQMEDLELGLEVTRNNPKVPTFPSPSDFHARDGVEPTTVMSKYMAGRVLCTEETEADEEVQMSPEDIKDAEAANTTCVFQRGNFCGKINHFMTQCGCFESAEKCYHQVPICRVDKDSMKLDEQDKAKEGCWNWAQTCTEQIVFCLNCGSEGAPECKSKHFKPSMDLSVRT